MKPPSLKAWGRNYQVAVKSVFYEYVSIESTRLFTREQAAVGGRKGQIEG
jgi:hypothetical protein